MRPYFVALTLLGIVSLANAQDITQPRNSFLSLVASAEVQVLARQNASYTDFSPNSVQRELYVIPKAPGERMMKVGKVLTIIGTASVIGGILVYNNRDPDYYTQGTYGTTYTDDPHEAGGQLLVGVGVGMIVPGVMVWIHGAKKYRKYEEKRMKALYIPSGKAGLGYRF